jgi:hypothetical protein
MWDRPWVADFKIVLLWILLSQVCVVVALVLIFGLRKGDDGMKYELEAGKNYFIRTVTHYYVGECVDPSAEGGKWLVLEKASWIADTGIWSKCLNEGASAINDAEEMPDPVYINRESIVDVTPWRHEVPVPSTSS